MKKSFLFIIALLACDLVMANPVDVNMAKTLGQKFVENRFDVARQGHDLALAYTAYADRGEACYYVFNVGETGFIIMSADDCYRPIIGYSENGKYDVNNVPPALQDYLDGIVAGRSQHNTLTKSAAPDVAADWQMLEKTGRLVSRNGGRGVDYLVQTTWDQAYPYNYYCPEDPAGSHGHTYVGCLATAMAQLVAFWKYPEHGNGSHCYYHEDYGQICADFQNTYYDWDHMANKLTEFSPIEEIQAVAMISFHCGVTIDMGYGPDGSGGASGPIPSAMHTYFSYSDACVQYSRDDFETKTWKNMVREQFDMGWPMYYGGCDTDGCHAFICDGYDDYDMFHFNLGWNGSSDGWYIIDEAPYTNPADAMFNFVPQVVYDATPSAPTNLVVTPHSDTSFEATVSWTNPTTYLDGTPLTDIESMVVMRDGKICHVIDNVVAGQAMTITDRVPYYNNYDYKVYAVSNGRNGKQIIERDVVFGPACDWKIVMTSSDYYGWRGNHISIYNMANKEIEEITISSSASQVVHFDVPIGRVKFCWAASDDTINNMSFNIYNSQNVSVFSFSGSSADMAEGVFYEANNGCGNSGVCDAPYNFNGIADDENVVLEWDGSLDGAYAYCVYRDDVIYQMVTDNSEPFVDDETGGLGHCYNVSVLCENGESELSNMTCVTVGEICNPARNLWYYTQDNGKPAITWDAPAHHEALTGYFIYRKTNADGTWERIKVLGADKTEYKETRSLEQGNWYYYKVIAYYREIDCNSIPAKSRYNNEYFVKIWYSPDGVDENTIQDVEIYPNPAKDMLTIKADRIDYVKIYNSIGQIVFENKVNSEEISINLDGFDVGVYLVKAVVDGEVITRKVSIQK